MKNARPSCLILAMFLALPLLLSAHNSWIMPAQTGRLVEIGHGHTFPKSEQAMALQTITVTLIATDGQPFNVPILKQPGLLTAVIPNTLTKLAGAVFTEGVQILTRTTKGVKTGPMDGFQGVVDSFARHRSGAYQSAPGVKLIVEKDHALLSSRRDGQDLILTIKLADESIPGAEVQVVEPGSKQERLIGKTNDSGSIEFKAAKPGLYLFASEFTRPTHQPQKTMREQYSTSLVVLIQ